MWQSDGVPESPPLSARSVILSLILGTPGRALTAAQLAVAARHIGINPATVRVALTRAVAADELVRSGPHYVLGPRLVDRRERQDAHESVVPWDGTWEMAVVVTSGRPSGDRAALRDRLTSTRLAELREGVWMRPANLRRTIGDMAPGDVRWFSTMPTGRPVDLVAALWDLSGWAAETQHITAALASATDTGHRFAVAAHLVRHLATDPLLPVELEPDDWPAGAARATYADYLAELEAVITA